MRLLATCLLLGTAWAVGCGASDDDPGETSSGGANNSGGATSSGGSSTGGAAGSAGTSPIPDAGADSEPGPTTEQHDPCAKASCWTAPTLGACGATSVKETFTSGLYGVHRYLLMAPAGVGIDLTLTRTAGSWTPVLVVHDEQGTTVYDGTKSHSTALLSVSALSPGSPDSVGVYLQASKRQHMALYATGANVVASGFSDGLPTDAKYTLDAALGCTKPSPLTVRGVQLDAEQELWVRYIAEHVVPFVPGSPAQRIDKSAYVTWWALKEGVLDVNNPLSYSNCSIPPDKHIGPIEVCPDPGNAWQVGLSGVQAAYRTLESVEKLSLQVFPGKTLTAMLTEAAVTAGFGANTSLGKAITGSGDRLRLSWLLRNGPIGFEAQYPPVHSECFVATKPWCFGTGWPSSASFAPTQAEALKSVADLKAIFQTLSP
ncbi:MAG: hypothetical protein AMXMBFR56_52330 [Polyangiaceae bacterium]